MPARSSPQVFPVDGLFVRLRRIIRGIPPTGVTALHLTLVPDDAPKVLIEMVAQSGLGTLERLPDRLYRVVEDGRYVSVSTEEARDLVWLVSTKGPGQDGVQTTVLCYSAAARDATTLDFLRLAGDTAPESTLLSLLQGPANIMSFPSGHWVEWRQAHVRAAE